VILFEPENCIYFLNYYHHLQQTTHLSEKKVIEKK